MTAQPPPSALSALSLTKGALSRSRGFRSLLACTVLVGVGLVSGCEQGGTAGPEPVPAPGSPTPTSSPSASAGPASAGPASSSPLPSSSPLRPADSTGVGGWDVRYLDEDGQVKTLRVEDFPR